MIVSKNYYHDLLNIIYIVVSFFAVYTINYITINYMNFNPIITFILLIFYFIFFMNCFLLLNKLYQNSK
jgi:hypothetical protein